MTAVRPNHRILVIDDTVEIHKVFRRLLCPKRRPASLLRLESSLFGTGDTPPSEPSFDMDSAFDGREGLERVRSALAEGRPYALAFVDMRMPPGWDGLQTIQAIWRECPDLEIVVCTAHADYSDGDIISRLGSSDRVRMLRKPFDAVEVRTLARTLTARWAARRTSTQDGAAAAAPDRRVSLTPTQQSLATARSAANIAARRSSAPR